VDFSEKRNTFARKKLIKAFPRHPSKFYRVGICSELTYAISALKNVFGRIGDVFMIYLEFCEKIKSFFEKLLRSDICFEFVCHSSFSTQLYPKSNKNYGQLQK